MSASTLAAPRLYETLGEMRAPVDWASIVWQAPTLLDAPTGDRRPVILVPGYLTDAWSMWPLKTFLTHLGYQVFDWDGGVNYGHIDPEINHLVERAGAVCRETKYPVTLIGWSLGGTFSREAAKLAPSDIREVITIGSPLVGGPKYTAAAQF